MNFIETKFKGVFLVENKLSQDIRGEFQKLFQKSLFIRNKLDLDIDEQFFSISHKGVIRGMHFQLLPYAQSKLVYVLSGRVIDVLVDLRKGSKTYKQHISFELSSEKRQALYISKGFAHGFQSLENDTIMIYSQSNEFNPESDAGINPFSIGMEWPLKQYVVSDKDRHLIPLKNFISPF